MIDIILGSPLPDRVPSMKTCRCERILFYILAGFVSLNSAMAFDPADHFEKGCSGCHTIGGGDGVGPDLKGITERRKMEWLIPFVQSPQKVIKSGDPVANELFNKFKVSMPDQDLSADEIKQLMEFIQSGGAASAPVDSKAASLATEEDIARGRNLFLGQLPLVHGGTSCVSCHSVAYHGPLGGGTIGPNLTQVYSKYGDQGLSKALSKPGFRIMKDMYAAKPLAPDEVFALKAFLYQADKAGSEGEDYRKKFIFLGVGGTVLILGVIDWIWRRRRKKGAKPWMKG